MTTPLLIFFIIGYRQGKDKFRADSLSTDDVNVLAVGLNDLLGDRESETGSFFVLAS